MNILENLRLAYQYLSIYAMDGVFDGLCRECGEHLAGDHLPACDLGHGMEFLAKAMRPLEYPEDYPEDAAVLKEYMKRWLRRNP